MKLVIFTDGASRGNPGPASYGYTISDSGGKLIHEKGEYIGTNTNNVAEYTGVLEALKYVKTKFSNESTHDLTVGVSSRSRTSSGVSKTTTLKLGFYRDKPSLQIELRADSKLVAEQLAGRYKVKAEHLKPIIEKIRILILELGGISIKHIPREQNSAADALANQALDSLN